MNYLELYLPLAPSGIEPGILIEGGPKHEDNNPALEVKPIYTHALGKFSKEGGHGPYSPPLSASGPHHAYGSANTEPLTGSVLRIQFNGTNVRKAKPKNVMVV